MQLFVSLTPIINTSTLVVVSQGNVDDAATSFIHLFSKRYKFLQFRRHQTKQCKELPFSCYMLYTRPMPQV